MRPGRGRASQAFGPNRNREIEQLFGWVPYPGTLNLTTDLDGAVLTLGEPDALTEHETAIGPLRWWKAELGDVEILVVRGERSRTPYLELVAPVRLRDAVQDGDALCVTPGWR